MSAPILRGDHVTDRIGVEGIVLALAPSPLPYQPHVALVSFEDWPEDPMWCDLDGLRLVTAGRPA